MQGIGKGKLKKKQKTRQNKLKNGTESRKENVIGRVQECKNKTKKKAKSVRGRKKGERCGGKEAGGRCGRVCGAVDVLEGWRGRVITGHLCGLPRQSSAPCNLPP